ncbi:MAG: radical SAM protein [Bdellovibrionales bacterium]|nr:radical SAM protein [Bdellovibrionales bacterium]
MKVLSIIPPLVQVNTPYPSTTFITGFLRSRGINAEQRDLGLELVLRLFSPPGLARVRETVSALEQKSDRIEFFLESFDDYQKTVDPAIRFLQAKDPALAHRIAARTLLPEGPRFQSVDAVDLQWAFGSMGVQDQAKHLASLYIDDLTDVVTEGVDSYFFLSRYGEKLAASQAKFDALYDEIKKENPAALLTGLLKEMTQETLDQVQPDVLLLTVPFPGCVLGALKIANSAREWAASKNRSLKIAMGGGYVNTELRQLKDARLFEFVDAITLDDGERPLECLLEFWSGKRERDSLLRTFLLSEKSKALIEYCNSPDEHDIPQLQTGLPTTDGLRIHDYLSMVEMLNPMHRYWSDLYWNKLMLAHGCYWHQCSFCDVSLDYIKRYEISPVKLTVERMKKLSDETGSSGFHFVDEAAPPAVLKELSRELIEQKLSFSWWGNIRFEKTFSAELTERMSDAGCVAVSGGLEVASDRLLKMMKKGVTVEQVARVTKNFRDSNVLVHAYLMYGVPTETVQETIDSLERVRQLFEAGCLTSAFWHRFSATAHSPVGLSPDDYGIKILRDKNIEFAENDLEFVDPTGVDHDGLGKGLRKAVYNFMLGIGLDQDVRGWFEFSVPRTDVDPNFVRKALKVR